MIYTRKWSLGRQETLQLIDEKLPQILTRYFGQDWSLGACCSAVHCDLFEFWVGKTVDLGARGIVVIADGELNIQVSLPHALRHKDQALKLILDKELIEAMVS